MNDDLISRKALKADVKAWAHDALDLRTISQLIDSAPAVDAVEVVRCKDCKHRGDPYGCNMYFACWHGDDIDRTDDNGFCECGVKREVNPNEGEGIDRKAHKV